MNTVDEILDYAIDQEQQAADFYEDVAQRAETAGMKKILMDFSEEEKRCRRVCRRGLCPHSLASSKTPQA